MEPKFFSELRVYWNDVSIRNSRVAIATSRELLSESMHSVLRKVQMQSSGVSLQAPALSRPVTWMRFGVWTLETSDGRHGVHR
ncbi:hypothetical protein E4U37_004106 [Claviceps purpurea]|nr:hypothetical protein E4U37_004106 [Claviceps purpurea]